MKINRDRIEVRSTGGKLLLVKTTQGYELWCPRTKNIHLITYEEMMVDYKNRMNSNT